MKYLIKKGLVLTTAFAVLGSGMFAKTSQTFFMPRTLSSDSTKELALHNYRLYYNNYGDKPYVYPKHRSMFNLKSTHFYQETADSSDLARYFLFDGKTSIHVLENNTDSDAKGVIASEWLRLEGNSDFDSKFKISPDRRVYGSITNLHIDFSKILKGVWLGVLVPVVRIDHNIKLSEFDKGPYGTLNNDQGDLLQTITEAFNSRDWHYGKLSSRRLTDSGIDDMQVKLGWNIFYKDYSHFGIYGHILVPMGNPVRSEYLFEPLLGNGRHFGLGAGFNFDYEFYKSGKHSWNVMTDLKYRYLFSAFERRSFDLKNGPWTRYLLVAKSSDPNEALPGIDFFTRDMRVEPRHSIDWWAALKYRYSRFNFEAGYNLWWKDGERVCLARPWDANVEDIGIADIVGGATSASTATISQSNPTADGAFTRITSKDLDLNSATHNSAMSSKIYGAIAYHGSFFGQPALLGFGGSYEFEHENTAVDQWSVWLKTGFSF